MFCKACADGRGRAHSRALTGQRHGQVQRGGSLWLDDLTPDHGQALQAGSAATLVEQAALRAERRSAVRHARMREAVAARRHAPEVPEALVLDADPFARDKLCDLLREFGFGVHAASRATQACVLLRSRQFAVAFLDVRLDGADAGAGLELCATARFVSESRNAPPPHLILVTQGLGAVDRVRAGLAKFEEIVIKPVTRGAIAGALDGRGIALPSDARRC
ncbi:MAG: response regulator [Burkholderiales bacterium]|nr:response regulator [Burkholderiales bacterium]